LIWLRLPARICKGKNVSDGSTIEAKPNRAGKFALEKFSKNALK